MSPPCQPYTRIGLQHGSQDPRAKSFLHLLTVLDKMDHPPSYILVENVKGFETSDSRDMLVTQLKKTNYEFQEFLLTPSKNIGIPNSRLRYYLLAKLKPLSFAHQPSISVTKDIDSSMILDYIPCPDGNDSINDKENIVEDVIANFLEAEVDYHDYAVPDKVLLKNGPVFDIVTPSSRHSCCFTKGYFHYAQGTGSILQTNEELDTVSVFDQIQQNKENTSLQLELLHSLKLRYFTPREVANLMGFPADFNFPTATTRKQRYRTLGNSINVTLVSHLMRYLIMEPSSTKITS
ncbi:S-adenosyl-L-methionine-dependent methyltransferase [Halteromyces radiatus]|uniref:S-adenosyl-L-methionine-dependent methyltransferase n=1 Tax=Halteromyces radiatus TaxID=101107 RepID=UPI00221E8EA7|nr:S-adenosyl-L-methionine-dependent methyltransferase [Halteromyces radiatus]KAI8099245.1 S-adenosyl-L-methionine-dependent methyltransferase [Halteromyces radiatus]